MRPGRFRSDERGRVPFALVSVMLLFASVGLAGMVSYLERGPAGSRLDAAETAVSTLRNAILGRAVHLAGLSLEEGVREGAGREDITNDLNRRFREVDGTGCLNWTGLEGWSVVLTEVGVGLDLGAVPNGRVVGAVSWSAVSPEGLNLNGRVLISEDLGEPLALAYSIRERQGMSDGAVGRSLEGMLYKLAAVRTADGELDGRKVVSRSDIALALELAIGALMNSSDVPSSFLLERLNITTVKASAVLAQYVLGLADYYLLWFRDYSGIGGTADSFFRWIGEPDDEDLKDERDRWYNDFDVQYEIERWAFEVLMSALHAALGSAGDDSVDVRTLDLGDISDAVKGVTNLTALGPVVHSAAGPPPSELASALDNMPCKELEDRETVLGTIGGRLEAASMTALTGLIDIGRGLANRAWDEVVATAALRDISERDPMPLINSSAPSGAGVPRADLRWGDLEYGIEMGVTGVHDVAPEARLRRGLMYAMESANGDVFTEVRPFEADFHIRILGRLVVHSVTFSTVDGSTGLERSEGYDLELLVPIDICIDVPVLTGLPLEGVVYVPSDTLSGDLAEIWWEFVNRTWSGFSWASGAMFRLFNGLEEGVRELGVRGLENLGSMSAASFSRVVEGIMRSLYERAWNEAVNQTWRFIRGLLGEELKEMLTFNATVNGLRVVVQFDLFEECINISYSAENVWFNMTLKRLAEDVPPFRPMPVDGFRYALLGVGELRRGGLWVRVALDPLTVFQPSVLQVTAERRDSVGKGFRFELSAPVAEKGYKTYKVSLSSVMGSTLKGVPVPGTGLTFDLDAGIKVSYDPEILSPEKLLAKALRAAWYETLEGYSVKSLYEDLGDPVLLEAFLKNLLNNIANSVEDTASKDLPEIEVFVQGIVSAGLGTVATGFSMSFVIKEPVKVLWDLMPWFGDNIKMFLQRMGGSNLPPVTVMVPSTVSGRLFVRAFVFSEAGLPDILGSSKGTVGGSVEANIPALGEVVGKDLGRWTVRTGIVLPDIASRMAELIPGFDAPGTDCDLWVVRLTVSELDNDRAKLSEVYYDTEGFDPQQEFVEIWNPTSTRIDISRWALEDRGGSWRLPDHLGLGPGERIVVARDRDGFRAEFGTLPRVAGLTLSLDNEAGALYLYDPWGVRIDEVGWKNGIHGWRRGCSSGQSLHRGEIDTDSPMDWRCGPPDPAG